MTFAGCPLEPHTFTRWQDHFVPPAQPFFISDLLAQKFTAWPLFTRKEFQKSGVPLSLHDTFTTYEVSAEPPWVVWLTQAGFSSLGRTEQLELLNEQCLFGRGGVMHLDAVKGLLEPRKLESKTVNGLFVWWPKLWALLDETEKYDVLRAFAGTDRLPCQRDELTIYDWQRISGRLPGARTLAGSFLPESGGNCFATVMAASGADAVAEVWVHPEPFMRWLENFTASGMFFASTLPELGDVLVWSHENAHVQHTAVSLGKGFVLHKEAQSWYAPRQVLKLEDTLTRWQDTGRLSVYKPK